MASPDQDPTRAGSISFGPVAPGWGSWDWAGADVAAALAPHFRTSTFPPWDIPSADVVVVVKHVPTSVEWAREVSRRALLVFSPIDAYGSAADVDQDAWFLRQCARILIHCERLRRYFAPYAPVEYVDHHIKFAAPLRERFLSDSDLLYVGVR